MKITFFALIGLSLLVAVISILVKSGLNHIVLAPKPSKKDIGKKTEMIDYYPDPEEILIIEETVKNGFDSPDDLLKTLKKMGLTEDLDYYMVKNYIEVTKKDKQSE